MPDESAATPVTAPVENGAGTAEETSGDVYTMIEAARLKGVSYHTVSRAVRRGKLPARRLGRMALIAAEDLRAWRPMRERAPHKYRRREPNPEATPALLDLASGERVELARNLSTLYEAVYGAAAEQPLPEFLALVSERLASVLDFRRVVIWQVDEATQRGVPAGRFGPPMSGTPEAQPLSELPLLRHAMARREAFVEPNVEAAGYGACDWRNVTSLFGAPLHVGNRQLGAIFADPCPPGSHAANPPARVPRASPSSGAASPRSPPPSSSRGPSSAARTT